MSPLNQKYSKVHIRVNPDEFLRKVYFIDHRMVLSKHYIYLENKPNQRMFVNRIICTGPQRHHMPILMNYIQEMNIFTKISVFHASPISID